VDCDGAVIDLAAVERSLRRISEPCAHRPSPDSLREALEQYGGNMSAGPKVRRVGRAIL
jgi:hypothetical protein